MIITLVQELLQQLRREEGQTAVEYGLVLALIAIVLVVALAAGLGGVITTIVTDITNQL